ncbi:acyl-CoA mutase large subunit family protein [Deinococcus cellulosilyticus]|uniref:Methylmalonyl-CoA mutase n=1 Tax=Deinococcus cellulosilyticus (strain DSM 18568 / NBRC 106333 / KACC 11606 / 5516J-15) TaxID=1223518 RepID=A0A511MWW9_DEIC1|nr:methylmalonyl-CoA mutase family protein [Deinococcus cellulosilyticus]GEM45072.1 methylmalonyl-CoA mutase [Deinococcus cellulosilyticus NBRC 106333 = KACC 11606]
MSTKNEWLSTQYQKAISKFPERQYNFKTLSDLEPEPLYTEEDVKDLKQEDLGFPGEYPYTRGVQPSMYRAKLWTMRMFAGFGSAEQTNERFKALLGAGQTGLSTAFDLPTLMGYDSDHPFSRGEVGKCGVAVASLADMEILFQDINPEAVTTSMTINSPANAIWAMYIANAQKQGYDITKVGGTIQNDILKEFIAQKEFIFPPEPSVKLVIDTFEWAPQHMPKWNFISVSGYHIREAGSTAVQELAFTLADGFHYVEKALERGLDIDEFAPRISFFFDVHNDFFEEIAKFRAARRIWAREMRHRYGAKNPRSWMLRTHAQTAGVSLTAQQPLNNISRVAIQALAAVLGGTNSLHTDSFDEALALPTEEAATIALRTQQIIAYETGVAGVVDPLGGSYYVEALTSKIEQDAMRYIQQIRDLGGVEQGIELGYYAREIQEAAYQYQQEVDRKDRLIVGVNAFTDDRPLNVPIQLIDPVVERIQAERLARVRRERDPQRAKNALEGLRDAAVMGLNTMPAFIECSHAYCTLGEMMDVLRKVYGEYVEPITV